MKELLTSILFTILTVLGLIIAIIANLMLGAWNRVEHGKPVLAYDEEVKIDMNQEQSVDMELTFINSDELSITMYSTELRPLLVRVPVMEFSASYSLGGLGFPLSQEPLRYKLKDLDEDGLNDLILTPYRGGEFSEPIVLYSQDLEEFIQEQKALQASL